MPKTIQVKSTKITSKETRTIKKQLVRDLGDNGEVIREYIREIQL